MLNEPVDNYPEWVFTRVHKEDYVVLDKYAVIGQTERVYGHDKQMPTTYSLD